MHCTGHKGEKIFIIQPLWGVFGQKWRKQTPLKWPILGVYCFYFFSKMLIYWARAISSLKLWCYPTIATSIFWKKKHFLTFSQDIFFDPKMPGNIKIWFFLYLVHPNKHTYLNTGSGSLTSFRTWKFSMKFDLHQS